MLRNRLACCLCQHEKQHILYSGGKNELSDRSSCLMQAIFSSFLPPKIILYHKRERHAREHVTYLTFLRADLHEQRIMLMTHAACRIIPPVFQRCGCIYLNCFRGFSAARFRKLHHKSLTAPLKFSQIRSAVCNHTQIRTLSSFIILIIIIIEPGLQHGFTLACNHSAPAAFLTE